MNDLIFAQISELFKKMVEKILLEEREKYLMEHNETRANGYYKRTPKTIFGDNFFKKYTFLEINLQKFIFFWR